MEGSREPPKTEGALLLDLPSSNLPGALPRQLLPGGERVLFETRPTLAGLYLGRLVVLVLVLLLFLGVSIELVTNVVGWAFVAILGFLIVYLVLLQRATAYALTDTRVIRVTGLRQNDFVDARYEQVQNMSLESGGAGGIRFDATPPNAPTGPLGGRKFSRSIYWKALREAPRVYSFVQEAFALREYQDTQRGLRETLAARVRQDRIPCAYCGTLIDIRSIDYGSPKCPSCGARLVEA